MCSTGFEKVSHKDASIKLWKSSPGRLIGTCHLTWTVALLTRGRARLCQFSSHSSRAEKLYGATLTSTTQIFFILWLQSDNELPKSEMQKNWGVAGFTSFSR